MPDGALHQRARPYSVPAAVVALVAIAVVVLPPILLGELTGTTYALTAAVVILALGAALPYALAVGLVTLPLVYLGVATYASPALLPDAGESASAVAVVRHFVTGFAYTLAAAVGGGIGIGADFATANDSAVPVDLLPSFMTIAAGVVAACFVALQLWRRDAIRGGLDGRVVAGTVVLGIPLVAAGRVALWVFENGLSV